MNKYEIENKIKELEWKYYRETDQKSDHACNICLQLFSFRVMLQLMEN